ncbi:MAG: hypothetical protein H6736_07175 [Alphaproteobacteria bacterium]|nr:hypothetical protein [Alphaproteobacteria bacterium]
MMSLLALAAFAMPAPVVDVFEVLAEGAVDPEVLHEGEPVLRLTADVPKGSALLFRNDPVAGMREVRFRAWLRPSDGMSAWVWVRVDGADEPLSFRGSKRVKAGREGFVEVRARVKGDATALGYGVSAEGKGTLDVDALELEVDGRVLPFPVPPPPVEAPGVTIAPPDAAMVARLARLGRVWGFVKMHHPAFADGSRDPDTWFFGFLQAYVDAADDAAADAVVLTAVQELGLPPSCPGCSVPEGARQMADLRWMEALPQELREALEAVRAGRPEARRFVGAVVPGIGNPSYSTERPWEVELDPGLRLLALFRFWNVIEWTSPYRDLVEGDWHEVLEAHVAPFVTAETDEAYAEALARLAWHVNDSHTGAPWSRMLAPRGKCTLDAEVRFVEGRPVVTASGDSQLAIGDVLEAFDGESVADRVAAMLPYTPASNEGSRMRNVGRRLGRGDCGPVTVTTHRGEVTTERVEKPDPPQPDRGFRELTEGVGYVSIDRMQTSEVDAYLERDVLIIDARGYPEDFTVFSFGRRLVSEPTPFVRFWSVDPANPGFQVPGAELSLEPTKEGAYGGRVVVLLDDRGQSSTEYHAMAFAAGPRTTFVGTPTAGADGNVSRFALPGGRGAYISGIGVFWPDGRPTQRVGIQPDIEVAPTLEGIRSGRDEVLEAALALVLPELSEAERIEIARPKR